MSRKTVAFKQKAKQFRSRNPGAPLSILLPYTRIRSIGRKTILLALADDEDPSHTRTKRAPGIASNAVHTEPIRADKATALLRLVK